MNIFIIVSIKLFDNVYFLFILYKKNILYKNFNQKMKKL